MAERIYAIRHPETLASKLKLPFGPHYLAPFVTKGSRQKFREFAENELVDIPHGENISSPARRCKVGAEIVEEVTGKDFTYDDRLKDIKLREIALFQTRRNFQARVDSVLDDARSSTSPNVLIISHEAFIRALQFRASEEKIKIRNLKGVKPGKLIIIK